MEGWALANDVPDSHANGHIHLWGSSAPRHANGDGLQPCPEQSEPWGGRADVHPNGKWGGGAGNGSSSHGGRRDGRRLRAGLSLRLFLVLVQPRLQRDSGQADGGRHGRGQAPRAGYPPRLPELAIQPRLQQGAGGNDGCSDRPRPPCAGDACGRLAQVSTCAPRGGLWLSDAPAA